MSQWGDATLKVLIHRAVLPIAGQAGYPAATHHAGLAERNDVLWEVLEYLGWRRVFGMATRKAQTNHLETLLYLMLEEANAGDRDAAGLLFMLAAFIYLCTYGVGSTFTPCGAPAGSLGA